MALSLSFVSPIRYATGEVLFHVMRGDEALGFVGRTRTGQWHALGAEEAAWTPFRRTRREAVADMLAGVTVLNYATA